MQAPSTPIFLAVETADGRVEKLRVESGGGPVVIGRDPSCHVVLPSSDVSRRHVHLEPAQHGAVQLTDSSANGTFVGDPPRKVLGSSVYIEPEIPFRVGPYRLRVRAPRPAAAQPAAPAGASPAHPPAPSHEQDAGPQWPTEAPGADPGAQAPPIPQAGPVPDAEEVGPTLRDDGVPEQAAAAARAVAAERQRAAQAQAQPRATPAPASELEGVPESTEYASSGTADVSVEMRRRIHRLLLDHLDLATLDRDKMDERVMRPKVREALTRICRQIQQDLPESTDLAELINELANEALGLGPLEALLDDELVSEIMVVDPQTIYIERDGRIEHTNLRFTDDDSVRAVIERIVTPLGRRIDESNPLVDARLKDGSRVNAIIPPLALRGPCITIRKFKKDPLEFHHLVKYGTLTDQMVRFLERAVTSRKNIVISGGTGSGKTTLLNVLSGSIPEHERVVTIEDAAELQLVQPHVVSLEARPANMEGKGAITIRDLLRNALRMRPDRILVGECRGGEALDMLQAMNTGHEGSMTTTHANNPREALARLETLGLMAGLDLPAKAIREQIASSIDLVLQQTRFADGSRRITAISEIVGMDDDGDVEYHDIFRFYRTGTGPNGEIEGEFRATGYLPTFLDDFITHGLVKEGDYL